MEFTVADDDRKSESAYWKAEVLFFGGDTFAHIWFWMPYCQSCYIFGWGALPPWTSQQGCCPWTPAFFHFFKISVSPMYLVKLLSHGRPMMLVNENSDMLSFFRCKLEGNAHQSSVSPPWSWLHLFIYWSTRSQWDVWSQACKVFQTHQFCCMELPFAQTTLTSVCVCE